MPTLPIRKILSLLTNRGNSSEHGFLERTTWLPCLGASKLITVLHRVTRQFPDDLSRLPTTVAQRPIARLARLAEGVFHERQAVVAPEQVVADEEGGHAEGAAAVGFLQCGLVHLGRRRVVEVGAEGRRVQAHVLVSARFANDVLDQLTY